MHQEFTLLPERTVAENVLLGREPRGRFGVDRGAMESTTAALLAELKLTGVSPRTLVRQLSVAQQHGVEIAKALSYRPRILVLDEPTAALTQDEVGALFDRVRSLVAGGPAVLYISHRLTEIFDLAHRVTVLKDGRLVRTLDVAATTAPELVQLMVGRHGTVPDRPATPREPGPVLLSACGLHAAGVHGVDLELRSGEIVGLAGLDGSGRTGLVEALAGASAVRAGEVRVTGRRVRLRSPRAAIRAGIAYLTADRKSEGLVLPLTAADNGLLVRRAIGGPVRRLLPELARKVGLPATVLGRDVRLLSGGNQQKVVLAKWLATGARVYLFDEPTRGIDVGAKSAVHELIRELADEGAAVLLISSDLPEVLGLSDRVLVMRHGQVAGTLPPTADEEDVMLLATGTAAPVKATT